MKNEKQKCIISQNSQKRPLDSFARFWWNFRGFKYQPCLSHSLTLVVLIQRAFKFTILYLVYLRVYGIIFNCLVAFNPWSELINFRQCVAMVYQHVFKYFLTQQIRILCSNFLCQEKAEKQYLISLLHLFCFSRITIIIKRNIFPSPP